MSPVNLFFSHALDAQNTATTKYTIPTAPQPNSMLSYNQSCAIAQAVSRQLPSAVAQVRSCGICAGRSGTGVHFLPVLQFPLPILIPPTAPYSSSITRSWFNRPNKWPTYWVDSVSPHPKEKNYHTITRATMCGGATCCTETPVCQKEKCYVRQHIFWHRYMYQELKYHLRGSILGRH
jgi:hypothetical protein